VSLFCKKLNLHNLNVPNTHTHIFSTPSVEIAVVWVCCACDETKLTERERARWWRKWNKTINNTTRRSREGRAWHAKNESENEMNRVNLFDFYVFSVSFFIHFISIANQHEAAAAAPQHRSNFWLPPESIHSATTLKLSSPCMMAHAACLLLSPDETFYSVYGCSMVEAREERRGNEAENKPWWCSCFTDDEGSINTERERERSEMNR
jgi:hypothetical protein